MSRILTLMIGIVLAAGALAAQHEGIRFQGRLTNPGGTPIDTPTDIEINLYTAPTGGVAVYTESYNVTPTAAGVFTVVIGADDPGNDLDDVDFSQPVYVGVTVATDAEMTPRYLLTASALARHALNAGSLGGTAAGDFYTSVQTDAEIADAIAALNLGSMAQQNTASYYTATQTDDAIDDAIAALNLGSMAQQNTASYYTATQTDDAIDDAIAALVLGTLAEQDADTVAITGGSINGTAIGAGTASTGAFTDLSADDLLATTGTIGGLGVPGALTLGVVDAVTAGMAIFHDGDDGSTNFGTLTTGPLTDDRTWTLPDQSGTLATLADIAAAGGGDFLADGSVPMTGALDLDGNDLIGGGTINATTFVGALTGTATNALELGGNVAAFFQNADNLNAGTLADGRLSANVPLLDAASLTFTGDITANSFSGDGSGLTGLDPTNIAAGTAGISISGNAATAGSATTAGTATNALSLGGTLAADYALLADLDDYLLLTGGALAGDLTVDGANLIVDGGFTSFIAPSAFIPSATFTAHDFVAEVDDNGAHTSRALRALMTGTNAGGAEVTGAWLEAISDGDITQGVFGQASYSGGTGGGTAIGLDGRARTIGAGPHGFLAIGTAGRADDEQLGSNIGVHAWARQGGKTSGLMAVANATEGEQDDFDSGLPGGFSAAILGLNTASDDDDYGLYVDAQNNQIVGNLNVEGRVTAEAPVMLASIVDIELTVNQPADPGKAINRITDASGGNLNFSGVTGMAGQLLLVVNTTGTGTNLINIGGGNRTLAAGRMALLVFDGTEWWAQE